MSLDQYNSLIGKKKPHKYNAKPTWADGMRFDSQAEAKRYREIVLLQKSGEIQWFIRQPPFDIGPTFW